MRLMSLMFASMSTTTLSKTSTTKMRTSTTKTNLDFRDFIPKLWTYEHKVFENNLVGSIDLSNYLLHTVLLDFTFNLHQVIDMSRRAKCFNDTLL